MDFNNTEIAFEGKTDDDLKRSYWLFKIVGWNWLIKIGPTVLKIFLPFKFPIPIIRKTIFKQFCGGENISDCDKTIHELAQYNIKTILDYSVEGKEEEAIFDANVEETLMAINKAKTDKNIPFSVFKVTGFARLDLLEKINMMRKYNKEKAIVFNTIQLYRWDRLVYLKNLLALANNENFYIGMKLVRGAYIEKERERALKMGYADPMHKTKDDTDNDYDAALEFCLENRNIIAFTCASHNEKSNLFLVELMQKNNIANNDDSIYFAQLLGMSDHISKNLSRKNYNVAKYVPYGPVKDVTPYLIRRAEENTSIAGQTGRELSLILKEQQRRKK